MESTFWKVGKKSGTFCTFCTFWKVGKRKWKVFSVLSVLSGKLEKKVESRGKKLESRNLSTFEIDRAHTGPGPQVGLSLRLRVGLRRSRAAASASIGPGSRGGRT